MDEIVMNPIAHVRNGFSGKFGIPRQSGLTSTVSRIIFLPKYRDADAFRGLEGYSHLWIIWLFSEAHGKDWSTTVRPPKLGGNERMGVFSTRSPYRPNSIGLSSVRLRRIISDPALGVVLEVEGADIMDGTPGLDVKPYLPYTDCHADASGGFALQDKGGSLSVNIPSNLRESLAADFILELTEILAQDPRPAYHDDPDRIYKFEYLGYEIAFSVSDSVAYVKSIIRQ